MSIQEFSGALKDKANTAAKQKLSDMQNRLLQYSTKAYKSRNEMLNAASILQGESDKFRNIGEKQGRTRLVITKESAATLIKAFLPGLPEETALYEYISFIEKNFPNYKAKHFEIYSASSEEPALNIIQNTGKKTISEVLSKTDKSTIVAFRGMNFSHANSLNHIVQFLKSLGAFQGISAEDAKKQVTELFERGHIYAQTTGRQLISIGGIQKDTDILDRIVKLSMDLDIASSSLSNKPIYAQLDAAIKKDFSASKIYMNIEFQEKFSSTGIGNQDTGKITKGLQILSSLIKLLSTEYDSRNKLIGIPKIGLVSEAAKSFDNLVKKLDKYTNQMEKVLAGYIDNPAEYIADLKSSDSLKQYLTNQIISTLRSGKDTKPIKITHSNTKVFEYKDSGQNMPKLSLMSAAVKKLSNDLKNTSKLVSKNSTSSMGDQSTKTNLVSLQNLINSQLAVQIQKNMGTGTSRNVLNYRSGRFAESAKVERMSQSREGMITAFYSYMRNPYGTFSEGGAQSSPKTRDPKLLISKSIREIAQSQVTNRMRAVLV